MGFKISGGQFYPPLPNATRVAGSITVSATPRATTAVTRAQVGQLSFTAASYTADEGTLLSFSVTRGGGASGSIAVDYAITITEGGPSTGGTGTITWNNAESGSKQTTVQLGLVTATRNGQITLSNARSLSGGGSPTIGGTNPVSLQIVNVVSAPAADVTTFSVEGSGSQAMSFGMVFKVGDVPSGQVPVLTNNSDAVLSGFQSNVLATHADGSVRHAMLHGVVTGGQSYKIRTGSAASGAALTVAGFLAAVPGSIARVLITGGITATCDLRDLLSSATNRAIKSFNATANLRTIEAGPNVLTLLVAQNVSTHVRVNFEVSWYGGSVYWVDVWVTNGYGNLNGMNSATYTGVVEINGVARPPQAFTTTPHYNHSTWHPGAETATNTGTGFWAGAAGGLYIKHNTQYIQDTGAVPNYRRTQVPGAAYLNTLPQFCAAMDNCQMLDDLDGPGAGDELAIIPRWCAVYIKSGGDQRAWRNMLANDNGGAAFGVWFVSSITGEHITENEFPTYDYNNPSGFGTGMYTGRGPFGPSGVNSHLPSVGYVSYLTTGRQFYLDLMNAWTTEANIWNSTNRNLTFSGRTIRRYYEPSNRAAAWQIRSNGHSAYVTPDNHFLKPQFTAWINGVAALYDVPHYAPGGTWRKAIGGLNESDVGAVNYSLFFHMFFAQATAWVSLDLGFTAYTPVAQYAAILMAGLFGSTGEYPFEAAPYDRLKLGTGIASDPPETASFYANFALVRSNNNIPAGESGTLALATALQAAFPGEFTGQRNQVRRQLITDSYFANILPCLSYLHRLGVSGGFECWVRGTLAAAQADFSGPGSQWDIGPREVPLPAYIRNAAPLTWTQISGTILPVPPGYPGDPTARINAWGGTSVKWLGSEIRFCAAGGHGDSSGNSVERLRLTAEVPVWVIERQPSSPTPLNLPHFSDGRPASRHIYYDQQFHQGRDQVIAHGCSFTGPNAAAFPNVDAYLPSTQDWLPANTYTTSTNAGGGPGAKAMNLASGCIYYLDAGNNNMTFRRWSANTGTVNVTANLFEFGAIYKAAAVDPIRGNFLHAPGQGETSWRNYSIDDGARTTPTPQSTPGLTPTQQSSLTSSSGSLEWDVRGKRFLHYTAGQDILAIDPVTRAASPLGILGTAPPTAVNGMFSKFRYIPELDIVATVPSPGQNTYFAKLHTTVQRPI